MNTINFKVIMFGIVLMLIVTVLLGEVVASPHRQVVNDVTLTMYVLSDTGDNLKELCNYANRLRLGCTAKPGIDETYAYPFASSNITIGIESDTSTGSQQGYLHNIVSQEMVEGATLSAYAAQAIAARTYTYDHIRRNIRLNNSNSFHVYMPFRYAVLANADRRTKVGNAISRSNQLYMTVPLTTMALDARYGADNCTYTEQGYASSAKVTPLSYLKSVYDPIGVKAAGCQNSSFGTGGGGMSSAGASRWGFGNRNAYNVGNQTWPVQWGEEPGTIDGDSWRNSYQILTHYYSGIHIRNQAGSLQTPDLRWNALDIRWSGLITPPKFTPGLTSQTKHATITLQNTGTQAWETSASRRYYLAYRWNTNRQTGRVENKVQIVATPPISIGNDVTVTLPVTAPRSVLGVTEYTLSIDMYYQNNNRPLVGFSQATSLPWFTHDITFKVDGGLICPQQVGGCGGSVERYSYLPIIMKTKPRPPTATPVPSPTATSTSTPTPTPICGINGGNLIKNGGFEDGMDKWKEKHVFGYSVLSSNRPYRGRYGIHLGGIDNADEHVYQKIRLPDNIDSAKFRFRLYVDTNEKSGPTAYRDGLTVDVLNDDDESILVEGNVRFDSDYSKKNGWSKITLKIDDLENLAGKKVYPSFFVKTDNEDSTSFYIDNVEFKYYFCE